MDALCQAKSCGGRQKFLAIKSGDFDAGPQA
jgi:hypothetical protein